MNPSVASPMQLCITVLRVSLGTLWIAHALLKRLVFSLLGTAQHFVPLEAAGPCSVLPTPGKTS